jgi:hypothetical protein
MAFTAATSKVLVETTREKLIIASKSIEAYIQVQNPGLLAGVITDLAAVTSAITAVSA